MKNQTRLILKTQYSSAKEVILEIDKLLSEFKARNKRNSDVELFLSELGSIKKPKFELTAYYDNKDDKMVKDLEVFKELVNNK